MFYLSDVFVLVSLDKMVPVKGKANLFLNLIYSIIFWGIAKFTFFYGANVKSFIFFNSFFCFYLARMGRGNWTFPLIWLVFVVAPPASFMGMDMLWKDTYALFELIYKVDKIESSILILVSILYLSGIHSKWYNTSKRTK